MLSVLLPLALLASACLPEGVRVPQSPLSGLLERKSGLIAYLGGDGNIYTIDQGGGHKTPITNDAFVDEEASCFTGCPPGRPTASRWPSPPTPACAGENPSSMSLLTARKDGSRFRKQSRATLRSSFTIGRPTASSWA